MVPTLNIRNQRGFTLIEALFSAIVLGVALLALAGFHAVALQDGTLVKMRMVATSLAQEKLDDLKSFSRLSGDASECGAGVFCYSEIDDDAGGQEDGSGNLLLPAGMLDPISGTVYTRDWTSVCYSENIGAAPSINADCSDADFKLVTVNIRWTDNKGVDQVISLQGVIYGLDPSSVARALANPASAPGPKVGYTPIGVPDAVPVPISTGDGKFKESSKPLPDVSSKGYSLRTEFDAVSYTTTEGASKKDSQLEFATVNCVCEFSGSGSGYSASYFYWDGASLKIKTPDTMITKMTGTAPTITGDKQDSLCDECCRDHHDSEAPSILAGSATTAQYDPDRPAADYTLGGNHKHYYYANASNPQQGLVEVAESAGNRYLEACRFARVDGFYRLLQDWRAIDMVVMPKDNYLEVSSTLTAYQNYLLDYLRYQARQDCTTASAESCTTIDQASAPSKSDLASRNLLNLTINTEKQLLARALYTDRVYSKTGPRTLDASYYSMLASKIDAFESDSTISWLDRVPFNEVNVTLLVSWHSDDSDSVSVTNGPILSLSATASDYYGVTLRGKTKVNSSGDGAANIWAYLLPSNSGLTGGVTRSTYTGTVDYDASTLADTGTAIPYSSEVGIDRHDHASSGRKSNSLLISRSGSTAVVAAGTLLGGNSSVNLSGVTVSEYPSGTACSVDVTNVAGSTASGSFNCSTNYTGQVKIVLAGHFFNNAPDADSNAKFDPSVDVGGSYTEFNTCTAGECGNFWVFGPQAKVLGKCYGNQCNTTSINIVSNGTDGGACMLDGTDVICPVTLDTSAKTWTGTVTISNNSGQTNYLSATSTCGESDGTSAKTTASMTIGPADRQSAFDVCATTVASAPSAPDAPTGLGLSTAASTTTFSWSDVANETGYKVYRCDMSGAGACAPSSWVSSPAANATSVGLTRPGNGETSCFNIKATNAGGDSPASQTMCVYRSGSTYTYSGPF